MPNNEQHGNGATVKHNVAEKKRSLSYRLLQLLANLSTFTKMYLKKNLGNCAVLNFALTVVFGNPADKGFDIFNTRWAKRV